MLNRRRLVIVPARSGSKRILNKNIFPIQGKPIILRTIEILKKSDLFTDILVSTDSPEILKLCQTEGIKQNSLRPTSLSEDQTPLIDVLKYEFEKQYQLGNYYDELWLYSATACLISVEELKGASIEFLRHDANDPLLAVTKFNTPIEWALNIDKNSRLVPRNMIDIKKNSQDFEVTYFDAGCFAIYKYESFLESDISFRNISYRPFVLPKYAAIDVDEMEDMHLVEKLFNAKN
jgi:CMP-N-acetylneuraminic acid synthetase